MGLFRRKDKEREAELDRSKQVEAPPSYDFSPPPGPPPPSASKSSYAPPPGPPPGFNIEQFQPPNYAPPTTSHFDSLYSASTDDERDLGDNFCAQHPLYPSATLREAQIQRAMTGHYSLVTPPLISIPTNSKLAPHKRFKGELQDKGDGTVYIRSKKDTKDSIFVSDIPLYSTRTLRNPIIYFEITITSLPHPQDAAIAIGYCCLPYPVFRLPGWHRGSLAVHSDDGRRYVNDSLSGKDFCRPFSQGETVGLGIDYVRKHVFFTRDGKFEAEFDLSSSQGSDPYRQYRDGSIEGLNGEADVFAAVGIYGSVGCVVNFGHLPFKYKDLPPK